MDPSVFTDEAEHTHALSLKKMRDMGHSEARDDALRQGFYSLPSDPTSPDAWMAEVILTSFNYFMLRSELFELARGWKSRPLYMEALTTDEHWGGADPTPISEIAPMFDNMRPGHTGPRHDGAANSTFWDGDEPPHNNYREAA